MSPDFERSSRVGLLRQFPLNLPRCSQKRKGHRGGGRPFSPAWLIPRPPPLHSPDSRRSVKRASENRAQTHIGNQPRGERARLPETPTESVNAAQENEVDA
ncbi:hypothetical protein chiPu_0024753, partial [Chiloscyllium punctatum]|nr:hypothetical protein [Chiloscyllium punctatum]